MVTEDWANIITLLTERTQSGDLSWNENTIFNDRFSVDLPGQSIRIYEEENRLGVSLELYNEQGRLLDTATVWDNERNDAARHLLELVRRKVLNVEEALDRLKKALS